LGRSYSTNSAGDGSYSLRLPPGEYEMTATIGVVLAGPGEVTVAAGQVVSFDLDFICP